MSETKITDLVPQETIDKIKELNTELQGLLITYTGLGKELAKGLEIPVRFIGDVDKLEKLYIEKSKEAAKVNEQLNTVLSRQQEVMYNTTPVLSRNLMELERINKTKREGYQQDRSAIELAQDFSGAYESNIKALTSLKKELADVQKAKKNAEKQDRLNAQSSEQERLEYEKLIGTERRLKLEISELSKTMSIQEKMANSATNSYHRNSQTLELMKDAIKKLDPSEEAEAYAILEKEIQELDAHLKDTAADFGEFQRNVGNYAIAGQNGVVTTESLIAAMSQEAHTTQDLIDQTKILEEAKLMLNKEDVNYQSTLDSLNAKIEENKRKLTDVSDIIGKEAQSVSEAEAQNKRLSEAIKHIDLTSTDAKKKLEEMRNQIERNNTTIAEATGNNEKFADSVLGILGVNTNLGSSFQSLGQNGNFIDGLNTKTKALAQTLMGLLANPWVLAFLGIAGITAGFKWWYDYNKGMIEASRLTQNFTGLTGDAADKITTHTQAIADHMGKGFDDTISAANTLVQQFGISWEEALTKIEDGIEAGADMNGKFIENINQFTPALRDAGVSVDEFVAILSETRNGIFDEKGVQDIIKGGTRLRAMTKQVAESLDACGISSKQMQEDLAKGNITMLDAVQQVSAKLKELPENSQEAGQVMKNVFGRTAAEGGTLLIQSIADVNTNLDTAKERMGNLGTLNRKQIEAQKELNMALAAVFKTSGTSFEEMTIQAKTYVTEGITGIINGCVSIVNWGIRIYNGSLKIRTGIEAIGFGFKAMWSIVKNICGAIADEFKGIGQILEGVLTFKPEKVLEGVEMVKNGYKDAASGIADEITDAFNKGIENIRNRRLNEINLKIEVEDDTPKATGNRIDSSNYVTKESDEDRKAREKAAKEELKRLHELEESRIAIMEEGHEKELATIRLNFKKKLDEIKGNSTTENALRIQLAEQCEKEVADCELKYHRELSKINIENRLESVKKGSKEELDLRLARIEINRTAEIEAAKKTGADLTLINAKFNRQRTETEEEYSKTLVEKIQKTYAIQQSERNTSMMTELSMLQRKYAEELALTGQTQEKRAELKERFEDKSAEITEKYAIQSAIESVRMLEEILDADNLTIDERERLERELADARIALEKSVTDATIAENERKVKDDNKATEKRMANIQKWLQTASEALSSINGLASAVFEAKIQRIEDEQNANEEAAQAEQERITRLVEQNVITEEEGESRKRAAEEQTAKRNEELEKKKAALQYKQAVFQKATDLAQAGISTALAITKAVPNFILAGIVGAMGAIQVATILATPIPKYAKGTDYHHGGPAIVGDGGRHEIVLFNGGAWITPDSPTLVDIPTGATVIPDIKYLEMNPQITEIYPEIESAPQVTVNSDNRKLEEKLDRLISIYASIYKSRKNEEAITFIELLKHKKGL